MLNVAVPLLAATLAVPPKVAPLGLFPKASPTVAELVVALPNWSCTFTVTAGEIVPPTAVVVGCWPYTNLLSAPATSVNVPQLLTVRPLIDEVVPFVVMVPLAKGVPALGRTWILVINNVLGTAPEPPLAEEIPKMICVAETFVALKLLLTGVELMFFDVPPPAVTNA